jgi:hypothetical protein
MKNSFEKKKISCIQPRPSPKMDALFGAIEEGFPNAIERNKQADLYVLWGLIGNNYQMMKTFPKQFIFADMPYHGRLVGDSFENSFWRWAPRSFHYQEPLNSPSDRFEKWNLELKPWNDGGDFILICPSSETMTRTINGVTQDRWIQMMYDKIKPNTKLPIRVRLKPRKNGTSGPAAETISMKEELQGCHALVTNASLTAIEALAEGVPVFTDTSESPAAWLSNMDFRKINNPVKGDREPLFYDLAYRQFSIKEYRDGTAYEIINQQHYY